MRRREFIAGLGAAAPWIIRSAHAQQAGKRTKRVGVLIGFAEDDPATRQRVDAFLKGLAYLGWIAQEMLTKIELSRRNLLVLTPMSFLQILRPPPLLCSAKRALFQWFL